MRWEGFNCNSTSINYSHRCIFKRMGDILSRSKDRLPLDLSGKKNRINVLELKAAKYGILTFTHLHPTVQSICGKNHLVKIEETQKKVLSTLRKETRNYFLKKGGYCRLPRSGFSITDSEGCKYVEVESGSVSKNLRSMVALDIDLFVSRINHQFLRYISWK